MPTIEEYLKPPTPNGLNENNGNNADAAQRLLPSDITNLLHGGVATAKAGDKDLARSLFLKVTNLDPDNETAWLWLASISEQANERFEFLQKVLSINPSNERALSWLKVSKEHIARSFVQKGAEAAKEGDKATAVQFLLQAIDYDSENEIAWMWLASLANSLEDKLAYLQRILNINPANDQVREMFTATNRQLARTLAQKGIDAAQVGDKNQASEILKDVLDYETDIEEVWLLKAHLAESLEEKEELYKRVVEINPNNKAAATMLASIQEQIEEKNAWRCPICQAKEKKPFEICRVCNSTLALDDIDFVLSNESVNESVVREGIQNLKRSFKDEITADDYYRLGLAYLNLKDLKESTAFFQASLRLEPENEFLASKVDHLMELRARKIEEAQVPVVTEEALVEEDNNAPAPVFTDNDEFVQNETEVEMSETQVDFFTTSPIITDEAPLPDEFEAISEQPDEYEQSAAETVYLQSAGTEEPQMAVETDESVSDKSEAPTMFFEDVPSGEFWDEPQQQEVAQIEPTEESHEEVSFDDEQKLSEEETHGWPMPEIEAPSELSFLPEEFQKIDTAPLEMPEALRAQVEQAFGESLSFEPVSEEEHSASVEEPCAVEEERMADETESNLLFTEEQKAESQEAEANVDSEVKAEVFTSSNDENEFVAKEETLVLFGEEQETASASVVEESSAHFAYEAMPSQEFAYEEIKQDESAKEETDKEVSLIEIDTPAVVEEETPISTFGDGIVSFSTVEEALASLNFEDSVNEPVQGFETASSEISVDSKSEDESLTETSAMVEEVEETSKIEMSEQEKVSDAEMPEVEEVSEVALTDEVVMAEPEVHFEPSPVSTFISEVSFQQNVAPTNYEIRVMQQPPTVKKTPVEMKEVNTVSQSMPVVSETVVSPVAVNDHKIIMIVDDSPTVRKLVAMKLGKCGHRVIAAVDGVDALTKIMEEVPDLILLDVTMPRLDGYQLCKLIKNNETTKHVPVVMLSGNEGLVDKVRGKMVGATTFLTKPFEPDVLLQTVNAHCGTQNVH